MLMVRGRRVSAPAVMGGKPCIRGMRVAVGTVVGLVAAGRTRDEILRFSCCELRGGIGPKCSRCLPVWLYAEMRTALAVKRLVDMKVSPSWVERLARHGFEAVHWSSIGAATARDVELLMWAASKGLAGSLVAAFSLASAGPRLFPGCRARASLLWSWHIGNRALRSRQGLLPEGRCRVFPVQ